MLSHESSHKGHPCFYADSQLAWQDWLEHNHKIQSSVYLIIYKVGSNTPSINIGEAIDTALCYGWIDSRKVGRDANSYYSYFTIRNPKSNWSRVNKEKIAKLDAEGRLTSAAYEMIDLAKKTGTWTALDDVENLVIPQDLQTAFNHYDHALKNWNNFPRNVKRAQLEWLLNAKKSSTRERRILQITSMAEENKRANH